MGKSIDFSKYLSKDDCLTLDPTLMSSKMMLAAEKLNEHLMTTGRLSHFDQPEKDIFYPLMQHIQTFFNYYTVELNHCLQLQFEIFNLLNRIKQLNHQQKHQCNTNFFVDICSPFLHLQINYIKLFPYFQPI